MQKIRIKEVHPATEERKPTVIVDEKGARMSGFDSGLKNLKPGDLIEAELLVDGKYINIITKSWKLIEESAPSPQPPGPSQQGPDMTQHLIEAQARISSMTLACQLLIAGKIERGEVEATAGRYYTWLVSSVKAPVKPPATRLNPSADAHLSDEELEKKLFDKARDPETLKTWEALCTACRQDFGLPESEVIRELGYTSKEEIGESPADCYRMIARLRGKAP